MRSRKLTLFRVPAQAVQQLERELDVLAAAAGGPAPLTIDYYDTPHGALRQAGWLAYAAVEPSGLNYGVQRLRAAPPASQRLRAWNATTSAAAFEPGQFASLPGLPKTIRRLLAQHAPLAPLLHAELQRANWCLNTPALQPLSVTLDSGRYDSAGQAVAYAELTLATDSDAPEAQLALLALARQLQSHVPLFLLAESALTARLREHAGPIQARKYEAMVLPRGTPAPRVLCHANLAGSVAHWLANQDGARAQADIEYNHQLRVALRRLHTACKLFAPWLDSAWLARLAPELRWLRGLLGQARDWDVYATSTLPDLGQAGLASAAPDALQQAYAQAERRRGAAQVAVQAALATSRYARLLLDLVEGLAALEQTDTAAGVPLRRYTRHWLRKNHLGRLAGTRFSALPQARQHRLRLRAKRLRYSLDFLAPLLRSDSRHRATLRYGAVLDALGGANDAVVALHLTQQLELDDATQAYAHGWLSARRQHCLSTIEQQLARLRAPRLKRAK